MAKCKVVKKRDKKVKVFRQHVTLKMETKEAVILAGALAHVLGEQNVENISVAIAGALRSAGIDWSQFIGNFDGNVRVKEDKLVN